MPPNEDLSPEEKLLRVIQGNAAEESAPLSESSGEEMSTAATSATDEKTARGAVTTDDATGEKSAVAAESVEVPVAEGEPTPGPSQEGSKPEEPTPVPSEPPPAASEEEERPKLQLARPTEPEPETVDDLLDVPVENHTQDAEVTAVAAETPIEPVFEPEETAEEEPVAATVAPILVAKKRRDDDAGILKMNRLLMAAAVLVLVLVGFQIWASVREKPAPEPLPGDILLPDDVEVGELPPIEDIQQLFVDKPWFREATEIDTGTDVEPSIDNFERFIRENIKLVGVSLISEGNYEAIIVDKKVDKMHFLQVGDRFLTGSEGNQKALSVVRITGDGAGVSDGRKEYELTGK